MDIIAYAVTSILFAVASWITFRSLRRLANPGGWIILGAAWAILAMAAAAQAFLFPLWSDESRSFVVAIPWFLGSLVACYSAYVLTRQLAADRDIRRELERYRAGFVGQPQAAAIKDPEGTYLRVTPAYARLLGKSEAELIGKTDADCLPRAQAAAFRQVEEKALESRQPQQTEEQLVLPEGPRWLRLVRTPLLDGGDAAGALLVSIEDITVEKEALARLSDWKQGLAVLREAEIALGDASDPGLLGEGLLTWATKLCGTSHAGLWQAQPEHPALVLRSGLGKLSRLAGILQLKSGEDIAWKAWQGGTAVTLNDYHSWPERGQWARQAGLSAALAIPLKSRGQVTWVLGLFHDTPGMAFQEEQVQLVGLLAQGVATRLQSTERLASNRQELQSQQDAMAKLQYRARLEHVLAVIAAHFINLDPERVDEGITRSLQTIARFAQVDRCHLVLFPRPSAPNDQPGWYTSEAGNGAPVDGRRVYEGESFRWFLDRLNQLETIHVSRPADLPPDGEDGVMFLQEHGIRSFTIIPLVSSRSLVGYVTFASLRSEVDWSADILALLKVSAEMFVNLLERKWANREMRERQDKSQRQIVQLEQRNQEGALITEMGDLLQACRTSDEAYPIITRYLQRLLPQGSGALYIIHDPKDPAEKVSDWGKYPPGLAEHEMLLGECWSLRRGRIYVVNDPVSDPLCGHIKEVLQAGYMCVPMIAHGVVVGVLHLRAHPGGAAAGGFGEDQQRLVVKIAEYIAIPLNNLKLRDELRSQAIRDTLTGLFNRRYMEETLEREIRRANRHATPVGMIMFDIDRMKPINDRFGHDAGDLVLRSLGREMLRLFRGEDVACRFGGDEFMVVLPEAPLSDVWRRAEELRTAVRKLELVYEGKPLGAITLSIGVAAYPDHGLTAERVLLACDAAIYASKAEGGDRIMMGQKVEA